MENQDLITRTEKSKKQIVRIIAGLSLGIVLFINRRKNLRTA